MINKLLLLILAIYTGYESINTAATVGKPVPNYTFSNILNSKEREISLKDLKGKVVILEFWATWCSPCIPAMKKLDTLQKEFKDEIVVITVSHENKDRLERFIKSSKTSLRVASDSAHSSIFKYKIIPHSVIIDKNGIVRAITSPENITKEVIKNLVSGNGINLPLKDDFYIDPNLKVKTIKTVDNPDYRIELTNYNQEKAGSTELLRDAEGNYNGIIISNGTIPRLYQSLFDISTRSRMVFTDGLSAADFPYKDEFKYNLTIQVAGEHQKNWRTIAVDFLNQNLDVNARMRVDTLDCYVLTNVDNTIIESTATTVDYTSMGPIMKAKKITMPYLTKYLENFKTIPILDKTNLKGNYDIDLDWQEDDPNALAAALKNYGLKLEKSNVKLPVEILEIYRKK